ncbi:flagellar export protein FliJ [Heyndrickxia camelliae]|uniref:Flagellar FliJ protein n=1 Tax=Heyndrickxia camelliae TaxID=1707093 RepID=A0A2N3LR56_9BACI|nr:flagellar export protein FliJ [Heyndrickxia camelliae]PKR87059.1 flagellar export protein FliJ [Heyndrickxia camelliae]
MNYHYKFEKVLTFKEREKEEALSVYQNAVKTFEEVAEELYRLLKKKEELEQFQAKKLETGSSVQEIRHYQRFIINMDKSINYYQELVMNARDRMNWCETQLIEKNVEVKKYERMKIKDYEKFLEQIKLEEDKQTDEISTLQYFHRTGN